MTGRTTSLPEIDAAWDYDHPDATEIRFRSMLPAAAASGDHDYHAQLLSQIARAQGLQMKFDEASKTLDQAESMAGEKAIAKVRILLERGRVLNSSKRPEEAKPFFQSAWDLAREIEADRFAVDAAHMLAMVESGAEAIEWNRRAIDYAERSGDPGARKWLGSLYNNLGWSCHERGDKSAALELFEKALSFRQAEGKPGPIRIAHWCVARALRSLGRVEEALSTQRRLMAEGEAEGAPDGFVREEIAECLLSLNRADEARAHFTAAYALLSQDPWLQRDEPDRLSRLKRLAGPTEPAELDPNTVE